MFENEIVGGAVPKEYIPGVEKGLESVLGAGVLAGFPVVDLKVTLIDGSYHEVDSSALAFEIASRMALREALQKGGSVLLEPIMKVEVVTPEDYTGSVIGDLNSRRGQIQGQDMRGNANVITAMVPLANMFGYVNNLRSMSQGRATFTMQFDHYAASADRRSPTRFRRSTPDRSNPRSPNGAPGDFHGQREIQPQQAALQHRDDRSRRSRQDVADGGDHQGSGGDRWGDLHGLRPDRQGAGREGARHHDRDRARRVSRPRSATTRTSTARAMPTT